MKVLRLRFLSISAAACLLGLGLSGCGSSAPQHNVILISIDTLRPDFLGCYGYERNTSPAMDELARAGVIFADVTSASPWTMPSHASMLTGLYPSTHGVVSHEFALTNDTLATWLGASGYQTMAIVNSHNIGFEAYKILDDFDRPTRYWEAEVDLDGNQVAGSNIFNKGREILTRAIANIEDRDRSRPFFMFLHFYDVHTDFTPDEKWEREFVTPYQGPASPKTNELVKIRNQKIPLGDKDIRYLEEMYDAEIRTLDVKLKPFFDYLDDAGLTDNTVIAITSDHGEEYFEHGSVLHGRTHYQELVRIPWIMRGPGIPAGATVDTPVHLVDVAPTLMRLANVDVPVGLDGIDVSTAWTAASIVPAERYLFSEADHNNVIDGATANNILLMVRYGSHVLHYDTVTSEKELYDLSVDPGEQNNIIDAHPELAAKLFARLETFMETEGAALDIGEVSVENRDLLNTLGYGGPEDDE